MSISQGPGDKPQKKRISRLENLRRFKSGEVAHNDPKAQLLLNALCPLTEDSELGPAAAKQHHLEKDHQWQPKNDLAAKACPNGKLRPDILADLFMIAGNVIEKGALTYAAYHRAIKHDLGDELEPALRPYFRLAYIFAREYFLFRGVNWKMSSDAEIALYAAQEKRSPPATLASPDASRFPKKPPVRPKNKAEYEPPRVLDADRSFLEQFEEQSLASPGALEWLKRNIYDRPDTLSTIRNWSDPPETGATAPPIIGAPNNEQFSSESQCGIARCIARFDNLLLTPLSFSLPIFAIIFLLQGAWLPMGVTVIDWGIVGILGGMLLGASLGQPATLRQMKRYDSSNKKNIKPDSMMSPEETKALWKVQIIFSVMVGVTAGLLTLHRLHFGEAARIAVISGAFMFLVSKLISLRTGTKANS